MSSAASSGAGKDATALFVRALSQLSRGVSLDRDLADAVMTAMMAGSFSDIEIAALLTALAVKGESVSEMVGAATAMRRAVTRIDTTLGVSSADTSDPRLPAQAVTIDVCGTGGTGYSRRNVSTAVAIVLASLGVRVAKHGNRAASSNSGSADVLERLGVRIDASPEVLSACLRDVGVAFLFARALHPAVGHAAKVRSALRIRTLFNLLGPMCNPAGVLRQSIGLYDPARCLDVARAMLEAGSDRVFVMHGFLDELPRDADVAPCISSPLCAPGDPALDSFVHEQIHGRASGLDDLSLSGPTLVVEARRGQSADGMTSQIQVHMLRPEFAGLSRHALGALLVAETTDGEAATSAPDQNAEAMQRVLAGARDSPADRAYRDAIIYGTALGAVVAADEALDTSGTLLRHAQRAAAALDDGTASSTLQRLIQASGGSATNRSKK